MKSRDVMLTAGAHQRERHLSDRRRESTKLSLGQEEEEEEEEEEKVRKAAVALRGGRTLVYPLPHVLL